MAKVYTRAQWARIQAKLPAEDREPYENSPDRPEASASSIQPTSVDTTTLAGIATASAITPDVTPTPTPMDTSSQRYTAAAIAAGVKPTVVTPTAKEVTEDRRVDNGDGTITVFYSDGTSKVIGTKNVVDTGSQLPSGFTSGPFPDALQQFFGSNAGVLGYKINSNTDKNGATYFTLSVATGPGSFITYGAPFTSDGSGGYRSYSFSTSTTLNTSNVNISTTTDPTVLNYIKSLEDKINQLTLTTKTDAQKAKEDRQSAYDLLYEEFDSMGLGALVTPLKGLIERGVSPSEFAVELRQTEAYKARFIANDARLKKNLRVLSPREYIAVEDAYRQVLRSYGLKQFDNDAYVRQFIENDVSAAELSDRVSMAVQRVQNADPAISRTLRDYYGIGQADLVAYVLDPNQQLQKIQRQVAAAEIGTAARRQGFEAGVGVAEQLAAQGITQAEAQRGYATIADILPTAEKLSQIYGATMEGYGFAEAEQELFNQLASAQRRRERLTQREVAEFSGQSGVARTSLSQQARGQF